MALARSCRFLIIVTPHKRPVVDAATGWRRAFSAAADGAACGGAGCGGEWEVTHERVRVRLYVSDGARPVRPVDFVVARHQPSGASLGTTVSRSPSSNESSAASSAAKPAAATWRPGVSGGIARELHGAEPVV